MADLANGAVVNLSSGIKDCKETISDCGKTGRRYCVCAAGMRRGARYVVGEEAGSTFVSVGGWSDSSSDSDGDGGGGVFVPVPRPPRVRRTGPGLTTLPQTIFFLVENCPLCIYSMKIFPEEVHWRRACADTKMDPNKMPFVKYRKIWLDENDWTIDTIFFCPGISTSRDSLPHYMHRKCAQEWIQNCREEGATSEQKAEKGIPCLQCQVTRFQFTTDRFGLFSRPLEPAGYNYRRFKRELEKKEDDFEGKKIHYVPRKPNLDELPQ